MGVAIEYVAHQIRHNDAKNTMQVVTEHNTITYNKMEDVTEHKDTVISYNETLRIPCKTVIYSAAGIEYIPTHDTMIKSCNKISTYMI